MAVILPDCMKKVILLRLKECEINLLIDLIVDRTPFRTALIRDISTTSIIIIRDISMAFLLRLTIWEVRPVSGGGGGRTPQPTEVHLFNSNRPNNNTKYII